MPVTLVPPLKSRTAPSLAAHAAAIASELRDVASDHIELVVLEAHQAGVRLAKLLGGAVVAGILIVTAWLTMVASAIVFAAGQGISWVTALLIAAGVNIVLAAGLAYWIRTLTKDQLFAATLRQLRRDREDISGIVP
jgi:uncharacterized membrane protein YqjE